MHLPDWIEDEYLEQLASEKTLRRYKKGRGAVREYIKTRERNEALDLEVYALADVRDFRADLTQGSHHGSVEQEGRKNTACGRAEKMWDDPSGRPTSSGKRIKETTPVRSTATARSR